MAEHQHHIAGHTVGTLNDKPLSEAAQHRIHEALKKTLEEQLKHESQSLGTHDGSKPAIHGSVHGQVGRTLAT